MNVAGLSEGAIDFLVRKDDLHRHKFVSAANVGDIDLAPGQLLLRIAKFAFTANNVTYAALGDRVGYWRFFPAPEGWGRVPVWGYGDVVHSTQEAVREGERFFGYYPMSTYLVVEPQEATTSGFVDGSAHRKSLPSFYNEYMRSTRGGVDAHNEDLQMLLRPACMAAFLLKDLLEENDFFGARSIVISSASSKTALGLALLLSQSTPPRREVIGLTSSANLSFVERVGLYDTVLAYDAIRARANDMPVAFVDIAGNGRVLGAVHHHFRDNLRHCSQVGLTHWDQPPANETLPGARPTLFVAAARLQKRSLDWGSGGFGDRFASAWQQIADKSDQWMKVVHGHGPAAVQRVYQDVLGGRSSANEGHIVSLATDGR